jgi:hypothetical protein
MNLSAMAIGNSPIYITVIKLHQLPIIAATHKLTIACKNFEEPIAPLIRIADA